MPIPVPKPKKELSLPQLKKKVQRIVNSYVRIRDMGKPCISCSRYIPNKEAGHYIAQGSSGALRFNLDNLFGQCKACNHYKRGNLINYRYGLISRIGEDRVKALEERRYDIKKWSRNELEDIIDKIKLLTNE